MKSILLVATAFANKGPTTNVELIAKNQMENNTVGNSMEVTYWHFTDGIGGSFIYMDTTLNVSKTTENSEYLWGTLLLKYAGTAVSYDVGLCGKKYVEGAAIDDKTSEDDTETIVDETGDSWRLEDLWFVTTPFG